MIVYRLNEIKKYCSFQFYEHKRNNHNDNPHNQYRHWSLNQETILISLLRIILWFIYVQTYFLFQKRIIMEVIIEFSLWILLLVQDYGKDIYLSDCIYITLTVCVVIHSLLSHSICCYSIFNECLKIF
jgi:hypothetical protein